MPNLLRSISCFLPCGSSNDVVENTPQTRSATARPNVPIQASAHAESLTYLTNRAYAGHQLVTFAENRRYSANTLMPLLTELSLVLQSADSRSDIRYKAAQQIAKLLPSDQSICMYGAERQANYFANYAIDLMLQCMESNFSAALETQFRQTLGYWINELVPAQSEFNLDGIIKTRAELTQMLNNPRFFNRQLSEPANSGLATAMNAQMQRSTTESVATVAVRGTGALILQRMEESTPASNRLDLASCKSEILEQSRSHIDSQSRRLAISRGLDVVCNNRSIDPNWSVARSPSSLLPSVWNYIRNVNDEGLKSNLTASLFVRLGEIYSEGPCVVGQIQRLLDVPSGVDPAMNVFNARAQFDQELASIGGKVNTRLGTLFDEDAKYAESKNETQLPSVLSHIGKDTFRQTVRRELETNRGVNIADLEPEIAKFEQGF